MRHYRAWRADSIGFNVSGPGAQRFFGLAAQNGIALRTIQCCADGFCARAQGRDRAALEALATAHGWKICVEKRRGPGRWLQRLLRRPGIVAGAALFVALVHLLSGFVWAMDLTGLDAQQIQPLRAALAENGIQEGARVTQGTLAQAQQALSLKSGWFGWVSLNFTGGCLTVESTPMQRQPIAETPQNTALYAKCDGLVLAVELDSGFAAVAPGQYVAQGQVLASASRPDHNGAPVTQAAAGRIRSRIERTYTISQPKRAACMIPQPGVQTGCYLYLLGNAIPLQEGGFTPPPDAICKTQWQPVRLGMIALPACLYRIDAWTAKEQPVAYSEEAVCALARRACRRRLEEEFPGAVVEAAEYGIKTSADGVTCTARFLCQADIAVRAPATGQAAP